MKSIEELTIISPEIPMKHYEAKRMSPRDVEINNLASKEASYIQVLGYVPRVDMRAQDWEDQVQRNEQSKRYGGSYVQRGDPGRRCNLF